MTTEQTVAANAAAVGDPRVPARVWRWVEVDDHGCWLWTGVMHRAGYGKTGSPTSRKKQVQTHRFVYECLAGPIPEGLELDHLCRVRNCCNPAHLEPVTHRENMLRGQTVTGINAAKTHCPSGHAYDGANLRVSERGYRKCRECQRNHRTVERERGGEEWRLKQRARDAAYRARKRAEREAAS